METTQLKKFAQTARRSLIEQVQAKLMAVLAETSAERREHPKAVKQLEKELAALGQEQLIEKVAYVWFNRLSALRFMDANGYNRIRIVSPTEGRSQPEILAEALGGYIDSDMVSASIGSRISALLDGSSPSRDPQGEAYRLLLVAACNCWHRAMPFLFEAIADYSELLMPEGLLAPDSILSQMRETMTQDACQDVEIIGWLYQFYISEKKDEVFAGLKKNKKITAENIPAATQLFTPHWIVRYLVENSLGRLWLLNRPGSKLAETMEYYIAPEEAETDFLKLASPEAIRICDPACGSGHMLTYAFDLLYAIYEEEGYDPGDIPGLILQHNLTGIEIDDRAGALAAFALAMKAAARLGRRGFMRMVGTPNICVLQNVSFTEAEMHAVAAVVGKDLFTDELRETLGQFEQAKNFGSLIVPKLRDPAEALRIAETRDFSGDLLLKELQARVFTLLHMAEALTPKYQVVVANPPYMGSKGMNPALTTFAKERYPDGKSDLFATFIERSSQMGIGRGYSALVTMESWMFLSSYGKLRRKILANSALLSMVHMPYLGKGGTAMGISFGTCAFVTRRARDIEYHGIYSCVRYYEMTDEFVPITFPVRNERFSVASSENFLKIPGAPIAYWVSNKLEGAYDSHNQIYESSISEGQNITANNDRYLRRFWEISGKACNVKWRFYAKGGDYRKWGGNMEMVVDWSPSAQKNYRRDSSARIIPEYLQFRNGITWTLVTSSAQSFRYLPDIATFGSAIFFTSEDILLKTLSFLNSSVSLFILRVLNSTMSLQIDDVRRLPFDPQKSPVSTERSTSLIALSASDWDAYETSWDFNTLPLLQPKNHAGTLEATYSRVRTHWQGMTDEMRTLEEENNRIFIDAYGLQDELTSEVPLKEITLTCNPAYRYGGKNTEAELEDKLRADTMREFISYAVGCMFGRYALDKPGLILANQGETIEDYRRLVPDSSFEADDDNVIPMLDGDWFADDITERFRKFLRVTFGEAHFAENLKFIEDAIGKDVRKYFLREYYDDHVKRYKKRPIYWLFSSPKGSFNALIYMHRYRPDTISVVLNDYLREYRSKLNAERGQKEHQVVSGTASEKINAQKRIDEIARILEELDEYERDIVYPLATERLQIDLDDGVKVNYAKFGKALKPIKGLNA